VGYSTTAEKIFTEYERENLNHAFVGGSNDLSKNFSLLRRRGKGRYDKELPLF
jgi:hypothetical protein